MDGNKVLTVKDIAIMAVMTGILFVQEQLLSSLPGIQLTIFLLVLYSKKFGLVRSSIIIVIHVILDNLFMNSFSLMYTPTMLIGLLAIPLTLCTIFKRVESPIWLALLGVAYSFVYCWLYIIPNYFIMNIDPIAYLLSDIIFEIILAVISFVTILLLYKPCSKVLDIMMSNNKN